jgi:long-subunit fatty acid transport protein
MNIKYSIIIISQILLFSNFCYSQNQKIGAGAKFLTIGTGARAIGMGSAFSGIDSDPDCISWNPAGISTLRRLNLSMGYNRFIMDLTSQNVMLTVPFYTSNSNSINEESNISVFHGVFGVAFQYSSLGSIPRVDEYMETTGEYSSYDFAGTLTYANNLNTDISYGISAKYIQEKIDEYKSGCFAIDVGMLFKFSIIEGIKLGVVIQNLGSGYTLQDEKSALPLNFKFGAGYSFEGLNLVCDFNRPRDNDFYENFGIEYGLFNNKISFRAGYNTLNSYSLGIGFMMKGIFVDYAFVPYKYLNNTHWISLRLDF